MADTMAPTATEPFASLRAISFPFVLTVALFLSMSYLFGLPTSLLSLNAGADSVDVDPAASFMWRYATRTLMAEAETHLALPNARCGGRESSFTAAEEAYHSLVLLPPYLRCNLTQLQVALSAGVREPMPGSFRGVGGIAAFDATSKAAAEGAIPFGGHRVLNGSFVMRGCDVRWYGPSEACDVVAAAGGLVLRGDSLMRHLTLALVTTLVGDYAGTTGVEGRVSEPYYSPCCWDDAYDDGHAGRSNGYCRVRAIAPLVNNATWLQLHLPTMCPRWPRPLLRFNVSWISHIATTLQTDLLEPGVAVLAGGLHHGVLDAANVDILFNVTNADPRPAGPTRPSYICALLHAPGDRKPKQFLGSHGRNATRRFNALIRERACRQLPDSIFDSYAPTVGALSMDGQHYPAATNILLAQLLLNHLAALQDAAQVFVNGTGRPRDS